jgi:hypothetical protein
MPHVTPRDYPSLTTLYLVDLRAFSVINPVSLETLIYDMNPGQMEARYSDSVENPLFKPYEEVIRRLKNLHWCLHPLDAANLLDHASPFLSSLQSLTLEHTLHHPGLHLPKFFNYDVTGSPSLPPFTSLDILMQHKRDDFNHGEIENLQELVLARRRIGLPLEKLGLSELPILTSDIEWFEKQVPEFGKSSKQYAERLSRSLI